MLALALMLFTGSNTPAGIKQTETQLRSVAECALHTDRPKVEAYLTSMPGSPDEERLFHIMNTRLDHCMKLAENTLFMHYQSLRGALAGAIYRQDFPRDPDFSKAASVPLPGDWWKLVNDHAINRPNVNDDKERKLILLQDFGNCLVDADPVDASALVRSEPVGPEESQSFHALVPKVGGCLPNGVSFALAPAQLRAFVAEPLLRKSRTIPGAPNARLGVVSASTGAAR